MISVKYYKKKSPLILYDWNIFLKISLKFLLLMILLKNWNLIKIFKNLYNVLLRLLILEMQLLVILKFLKEKNWIIFLIIKIINLKLELEMIFYTD